MLYIHYNKIATVIDDSNNIAKIKSYHKRSDLWAFLKANKRQLDINCTHSNKALIKALHEYGYTYKIDNNYGIYPEDCRIKAIKQK